MKSIAIKRKERVNRFISTKLRLLLREAKLKGKLRSIKFPIKNRKKVTIKIVHMTMGKAIINMITIITTKATIMTTKAMIISTMITVMTTAKNNISTARTAVTPRRNLQMKMRKRMRITEP